MTRADEGGLHRPRLIAGLVSAIAAVALAVPAAASAWTVTVHVHGAGTVQEVQNRLGGNRNQMNCTVSPDGKSEATVTNCVGGTPTGLWSSADVVRLGQSVSTAAFNRGWRYSHWLDSSASGWVNCDPQPTTGVQELPVYCEFQIFQNLEVDLYFDDLAGPQDTSISGGPSNTTNQTSASFSFNAASDPDATFECRLDRPGSQGVWSMCGSPADKSEGYSTAANGTYTFRVRGKDPSGNVDETEATRTWTVDTVAPTPQITNGPPQGSFVPSDSASFAVATNEGTLSCGLDGNFGGCSGGTPSYSNLDEGEHTFTLRATDAAGNVTNVTRTWTVDTVTPTPQIGGGPADGSTVASASALFSPTTNEGALTCSLDGSAFAPCSGPVEHSNLGDGAHTFTVRATDQAGNVGEATRSWRVDTTAPTPALQTKPPKKLRTSKRKVRVEFTFAADEQATFTCARNGGAAQPCSSPLRFKARRGKHRVAIVATDAVGNVSAPVEYTFKVKRR